MAHQVAPDGSIYVDTAFINATKNLPGCNLEHMGMGEFSLTTPKGTVEFDRMRGKPFEGMSGRPHKFYDREGYGNKLAQWVVEQMEHHHLSEAAPATVTARVKNASDLQGRLQEIMRLASQPNPSRMVLAAELYGLAGELNAAGPVGPTRPLHEIADEIRKDWKQVNYAAKPYLEAMSQLDKASDSYGSDSGMSIILYFLNNSSSWRGETAKRIKAELKRMVR